MVYNRDVFDKFGTAYPKDGMTWDQALELSKKLTKTVDGVSYIGLDAYNATLVGSGLALSFVDLKISKASLQTDGWKKVLDLFDRLYKIPGYVNNGVFSYGINGFAKTKNVAMFTPYLDMVVNQISEEKTMNWDFTQLPNFEGRVGKGMEYDAHLVMLSNVSKNKEIAYQVMQLVSASEDVQLDLMQQGRLSVLNNPEWQKQFAANYDTFKGKNVDAVFKAQFIVPHMRSPYSEIVTISFGPVYG